MVLGTTWSSARERLDTAAAVCLLFSWWAYVGPDPISGNLDVAWAIYGMLIVYYFLVILSLYRNMYWEQNAEEICELKWEELRRKQTKLFTE
jgi:hypothetical protein